MGKKIKNKEYTIQLINFEGELESEQIILSLNEKEAINKALYYRAGFMEARGIQHDEVVNSIRTIIELELPPQNNKVNKIGFKNDKAE